MRTIFSKNFYALIVSFSLFGFLPFVHHSALAQEFIIFNDEPPPEPREMVLVHGKLLDARSNEPIAGTINFEKMPRANNVGIISNLPNGEYQLHMLDHRKYTLEINANGYLTVYDVMTIDDIDSDGRITKDYLLTPAEEGNVLRMNNLFFEISKSDILESSYDELNALAQMLHNNLKMKIQLEGHTDFRGNPKKNVQLSEDRVKAVKSYLIQQNIRKGRIKLKAFGGTKPLTHENSEEAKKLNRRVEVRILAK